VVDYFAAPNSPAVTPALCPFELWLAPGKPRSRPGDTISLERNMPQAWDKRRQGRA